jgi:hypothetical protein
MNVRVNSADGIAQIHPGPDFSVTIHRRGSGWIEETS